MQTFSFHLIKEAAAEPGVCATALTWGGSQRALPWFVMTALIRGVMACRRGIDVIHIGDGLLAPVGLLLRSAFRIPAAITVHGLDITYRPRIYQAVVPALVGRYERVICNSRATLQACIDRGINPARCVIVRLGVEPVNMTASQSDSREILSERLGVELRDRKLLLTVGRLVPRKGVQFFLESVMPELIAGDRTFLYLVVGDGPERERILASADAHGISEAVVLTGVVDESTLRHAYNASDLFVAPNVSSPGDMEGFGLVVFEAAAAGCPILAADLEGLRDTLSPDGDWFVPSKDGPAWVQRVQALFSDPAVLHRASAAARDCAAQNTWRVMAHHYISEFEQLVRA